MDCEHRNGEQWRERGAVLRMKLRRHDLTYRELQLAELILDKTFGWQRKEIVFPQLRYFKDLTGISETDVVKVLKSLHGRRVIRIQTIKGRPTYSINVDSEAWTARPRVSAETMQATLNLLRENNDLEPVPLQQDASLSFFKPLPEAKQVAAEMGKNLMGEPMGLLPSEFPYLT